MIFKPELIKKIVAGKKTQTRRPVKAGEMLWRQEHFLDGWKPIGVIQNDRAKVMVGRDYAVVPGRGKPCVCWTAEFQTWRETGMNSRCYDDVEQMLRIRVLDIRREDVRNISMKDAHAEGFDYRVDFFETWVGFYDLPAAKEIEAQRYTESDEQVFQYLWARPKELYQAWAYTFEIVK